MRNTLLITTLMTTTAVVTAGDFTAPITDSTPSAVVPSGESRISGTLSFDANSHFISYGSDVWGGGSSATDAWTFNPSLSIDYKLTDAVTLNAGIWADINDNLPSPNDDFDNQEVDIWLGASYSTGIATFSATFQTWQYAGASEEVLDLAISLDTFLNPSILLHQRLGAGASGGNEGTFLVASIEESFTIADKYTFSVPVNVGYSVSDDYHAGFDSSGSTDNGFAYVSIGLQSSIPITEYSSFNYGITYYIRDEDVTGDVGTDNFFAYNAGISFSF